MILRGNEATVAGMATFSEKAAFELRAEGRGGADSSPSTEESGAAGREGTARAKALRLQRALLIKGASLH